MKWFLGCSLGLGMMAVVRRVMLVLLLFSISLRIKKCSVIDSDSILGKEADECKAGETLLWSSLWQVRAREPLLPARAMKQGFFVIFILLCGDVELNPGPGCGNEGTRKLNSLLMNRGIKIFHQNARGLLGNIVHVAVLLQSFPGMDILTLSETHLEEKNDLAEAACSMPGYSSVSRPRKSGKGGGVTAFIKDGIIWNRRQDLKTDSIEAIWIEIRPKHSRTFLVGVMYRPPVGSKHLSKDSDNQLHSMLSTISESSQETILLGDLNANFLKQEDKDKELKAVLRVFGLKQLITKPTRITGSCESLLDVILTSCPESVARTEVIATSIGDHEMVGCIRKLNC